MKRAKLRGLKRNAVGLVRTRGLRAPGATVRWACSGALPPTRGFDPKFVVGWSHDSLLPVRCPVFRQG